MSTRAAAYPGKPSQRPLILCWTSFRDPPGRVRKGARSGVVSQDTQLTPVGYNFRGAEANRGGGAMVYQGVVCRFLHLREGFWLGYFIRSCFDFSTVSAPSRTLRSEEEDRIVHKFSPCVCELSWYLVSRHLSFTALVRRRIDLLKFSSACKRTLSHIKKLVICI